MLRACQYVLIRLAPNPIRDEAVTVGVALFDARQGGFTGVRLLPDLTRVRQLAPQFDPAVLEGLEADLLLRLRTSEPAWLSRQYFLELAHETFSHTLRLSDPQTVLTADPATELDRLYQQYAAPVSAIPDAEAAVARGARRRVLLHLRRIFTEERVLRHMQRNVRAGEWLATPDRFAFDFHYQERGGQQHHVIQALPWASGEGMVKELCFTVERVRRHLGPFDVAAFHDDAPDEEAAYLAALLSEAGVRLLPLAEAAAEAGRIRAALGLR
ncbi:MAG: DUF3037 domain-containing protein [Acidobacteria bacterium]|nr:MAG: DUF3037 domain-containing protein [Acidobacteriota bacterium]